MNHTITQNLIEDWLYKRLHLDKTPNTQIYSTLLSKTKVRYSTYKNIQILYKELGPFTEVTQDIYKELLLELVTRRNGSTHPILLSYIIELFKYYHETHKTTI